MEMQIYTRKCKIKFNEWDVHIGYFKTHNIHRLSRKNFHLQTEVFVLAVCLTPPD